MHRPVPPEQNGCAAKSVPASAAVVWDMAAPAKVRKLYQKGKPAAGWRAWFEHLGTRPQPIRALPRRGGGTLLLGLNESALPDFAQLDRLERLLGADLPGKKKLLASTQLSAWLVESARPDGLGAAYRSLIWARALPTLAARLPAETWWRLLERLFDDAACASNGPSESLGHQLLAVELPLWLAHLLPEIARCRQVRTAARQSLQNSLIELLDEDGLPAGPIDGDPWPMLASWSRSCALLAGDADWRDHAARSRFRAAVLNLIRAARQDGEIALDARRGGPTSAGTLELAARVAGWKDPFLASVRGRRKPEARLAREVCRLARRMAKSAAAASPQDSGPGEALPCPTQLGPCDVWPSRHAAAAKLAVLRTGWSQRAPRVAVDYRGADVEIELSSGCDVLVAGPWRWQLALDARPVATVGPWHAICWVTDEHVDYLELAIDLAGGQVLQRQIVLARQESLLLLADAIVGDGAGRATYESWLPLAEGAIWSSAEDTNEGVLSADKPRATALPLSLPEWRSERHVGQMVCEGRELHVRQNSSGPRSCAALLIDLNPARIGRPLTWRRLTVAQSRHIEPAHQAVGFRAQIGRRQWLVYRSLAAAAPRSVLGQHLASDFLWARFRRSGKIKPIVEITA